MHCILLKGQGHFAEFHMVWYAYGCNTVVFMAVSKMMLNDFGKTPSSSD